MTWGKGRLLTMPPLSAGLILWLLPSQASSYRNNNLIKPSIAQLSAGALPDSFLLEMQTKASSWMELISATPIFVVVNNRSSKYMAFGLKNRSSWASCGWASKDLLQTPHGSGFAWCRNRLIGWCSHRAEARQRVCLLARTVARVTLAAHRAGNEPTGVVWFRPWQSYLAQDLFGKAPS